MSAIRNFFLKPWFYVVIVIFGTSLKFYHLNSKLFWLDEISTILYTTGIKEHTIADSLPVNRIVGYGYYDSLLHLNTKPYTIEKEVTGIFSETHLTPAHYVFLTMWYRLSGDNNIDYRLFSVCFFILSLPIVFLLARTLFSSSLAAWIAVSLYSVSPFIHFEAQEARYHSQWVFFFILSNYLFLLAIKHNKVLWWIGYSAASIFALYTAITSGLFIFSHLVYVLLFKKALRIQFLVSLLFIVLAYLPWIYFLYSVREKIENGLSWHKIFPTSFFSLDLLFFQLLGFVRPFVYLFDYNLYYFWFTGNATKGIYPVLLFDLVILAFIIYSFFYLFAKASKEIKWFLVLIILPLFLLFYLSDFFRHAGTSILWRYQIVNMVGIILVVTYLLKNKIAQNRSLFIGIYLGLLTLSITSIFEIASNRCWNTSPACISNTQESLVISQSAHPLIITEFREGGFFQFYNFLAVLNDSQARNADVMLCKGVLADLKGQIASKGYSEIYIVQASESLTQQVKAQFGESMHPVKREVNMFSPQLWRIKL